MAEVFRRPGPYVPLSVTFHTGRTGTAIIDEFGLEGLGVWTAFLAAAKQSLPEGQVMFAHEDDWGAIGLSVRPSFPLKTFLSFLGRRKQTRTTRHGRVMYVQLTRWTRWTETKQREDDRRRKSRKRAGSIPDIDRTPFGQVTGHESDQELELELEERQDKTSRSKTTSKTRPDLTGQEPEWGSAGEQAPLNGEPEYREMTPLSEEVEKVRREWAEAS